MNSGSSAPSLRLLPGIVIVALMLVVRYLVPPLFPEYAAYGFLGGLGLCLVILGWWLLFSRLPHRERWLGLGLMVVSLFLFRELVHPSIATGMMGLMLLMYALPTVSAALVVWAVLSRNLQGSLRWLSMAFLVFLASGFWTSVRSKGITGTAGAEFVWRWTETAEDRLLAEWSDKPSGEGAVSIVQPDWHGFRGPGRDSTVLESGIDTDWATSPPTLLWRQPVGPAWSSFAVAGDAIFTQEQRGEEELVSCYRLATGETVWTHSDDIRFWEANAGAGPRSTPTLYEGRILALGATGLLNVLDASDGTPIWSRNAAEDTQKEIPDWGFAASPLGIGDTVIVATAGTLVGYDLENGALRWVGPDGGSGYGSPHAANIDGVDQVLLISTKGITSLDPATGALFWEHGRRGIGIVQPAFTENGDILVGKQEGTARLMISRNRNAWTVEERWTTNRLKPYFNDFVVHRGHAYGFDGSILACVDLENGERAWKGGRYGSGQMMLAADRDILIVLSEKGELALVRATPDRYEELARLPGIEGKTWNHPVLVNDTLLVRNSQEMAAFRLATAEM